MEMSAVAPAYCHSLICVAAFYSCSVVYYSYIVHSVQRCHSIPVNESYPCSMTCHRIEVICTSSHLSSTPLLFATYLYLHLEMASHLRPGMTRSMSHSISHKTNSVPTSSIGENGAAGRKQQELLSSLPDNSYTLRQTSQLDALLTIVRDKNTNRGEFIFYSDRIIRLLVRCVPSNKGYGHLIS